MAEQPLSQQGRGCKRKYKLVHLSNYQLSTIEDNVPHSSWKNSLDNEQIADKNVKISQLVNTSATQPRRSHEELKKALPLPWETSILLSKASWTREVITLGDSGGLKSWS